MDPNYCDIEKVMAIAQQKYIYIYVYIYTYMYIHMHIHRRGQEQITDHSKICILGIYIY